MTGTGIPSGAHHDVMFTGIRDRTPSGGTTAVTVAPAAGLATAGTGLATVGTGLASADPDGQMCGDPTAAAPYRGYQHRRDRGLMAVAEVVGRLTGREPARLGVDLRGVFTRSEAHRGGS